MFILLMLIVYLWWTSIVLDAVYAVVNWALSQPQGNLYARGKYKPM